MNIKDKKLFGVVVTQKLETLANRFKLIEGKYPAEFAENNYRSYSNGPGFVSDHFTTSYISETGEIKYFFMPGSQLPQKVKDEILATFYEVFK